MPHIKRRAAIIRIWAQRIRKECGGIRRNASVQVVAVIQSLRKGVNAAELQTVRPMTIQVHLEAVIRADALRKPVRRVPHSIVGEGRPGREVERSAWISSWHGEAGQTVGEGRFASSERSS